MEQGPLEEAIMAQVWMMNTPVPAAMRNAPELTPGLEFYYRAFLELTTCRPVGMGEGCIPWSAIETYCQRYALDGEEYEDFSILIRAMDSEYLKFRASKASNGKGKIGQRSTPPPTPRKKR